MTFYSMEELKHPQFVAGNSFQYTETFINSFCICPMVPHEILRWNPVTGWKTSGMSIRFSFFMMKMSMVEVSDSFIDSIAIKTYPVVSPAHFSPLGVLIRQQPKMHNYHTTMQTMEYRVIGNALIYYPSMPKSWYSFFRSMDFVYQGNMYTVLHLMVFSDAYYCMYAQGFFVVLHYCSFEQLTMWTEENCRNLLITTFSNFGHNTKMSYFCEKYRCFEKEDTTDMGCSTWNEESWCDPKEMKMKYRVTRHK